ncbi:MAG: tol-pal system protein YbgF [Xanthomonadaceae bacterium]|nr:tol-pal system protein YbgF [Xanthomonadaceae bacterium]
MLRVIPMLVLGAALAGCASGAPGRSSSTGPTQAERIADLERRVQLLDNRVESGQMLELLQRVDTMQAELRELRGEVERLGHDGESLARRQRDLYLDLDRRLQTLETGGSPAGGGAAATQLPMIPEAAAATPRIAAATPGDEAAQRSQYDAAYRLLLEGRYPAAIEAFQRYLDAYPAGRFADNAQYWLGEAFYVSRDFPTALAEFNKVIERFPQSTKTPDAMLKVGYTQYELRQWDAAREVLAAVAQRAPGTTAARLAQDRLDRMRQEGR